MRGKRISELFAIALVCFSLLGCSALGLGSPQPIQIRATATATTRPPFTPRPSDTPWPTFTPVPTVVPVTPGVLTGVISSTVNVRLGPGTNYLIVSKLNKGTKISVRGRDVENRWLVLIPPPSGWVMRDFVTLNGEASTLPVVDAPPTPVPTPTFAPSPTPQPSATPPMYVDFRADSPWVIAGQCTTLRWDVEGVRGVYFNGQGQPGHGSQEVCPAQTQTFVLHVVLNSGYLDRAISVAVLPAPPTTAKP
jgi:uncharacterized protein YraI